MSAGATQPHCDNPASNPETEIKLTIPVATSIVAETLHVTSLPTGIKIYDILSREVAILVDGEKSAGNYSVRLDASNLSSGIYFYKLTAGNFTETKKMTILK